MTYQAHHELEGLNFLSDREVIAFKQAGFHVLSDLLSYYPKRYEDRRSFDRFPSGGSVQAICLKGKVADTSKKFFGSGSQLFEIVVMDESGGLFGSNRVVCRWFKMPYIQNMIMVGQQIIVYGKVKELNGKLVMDHPEFEVFTEESLSDAYIHVERIVPIYRNLSGISQRRLRAIMYDFLQNIDAASIRSTFDVIKKSRLVLWRGIHFPEIVEEYHAARRAFALEEFFKIQLNARFKRMQYRLIEGRSIGQKTTLLKAFYHRLPFDLTGAQKQAIKEIISDMRDTRPMNRMLQGDVGSGKTFVAMAAALMAVDSGCQAILMAPTQILAEQHYLTFNQWLKDLGVCISLHTSNRNERNDDHPEKDSQILIGTHALLFEEKAYKDVGIVIIDEQHKFGVSQRKTLIQKGSMPDVLVMSATPIPRTLSMTVYGDLDVSILNEKPAGRGEVITAVRSGSKQSEVNQFLKKHLDLGRQAYIVYPLVEDSDKLKMDSVVSAYDKWKKRLPKYRVGLLHGKLKSEEKDHVMNLFRDHQIDVLVSTTVIEVGVDVPNASLMFLYHAERFGLAQIHQLRGRIGRGGHKGYCVLFTDGKHLESGEKLKILEQTHDGFEVAEADLRLRGPGDLMGTQQSGLSNLRFPDLLADFVLVKEARDLVDQVLNEDPCLNGKFSILRSWIQDHEESMIS